VDWRLDVLDLVDAGDEVVAVLHQSGTSKTTGLQVDMDFAQLWTVENGKQTYMRMYADPGEALRAAGPGLGGFAVDEPQRLGPAP